MVTALARSGEDGGAAAGTERLSPKMSRGPTLFSCAAMENDRWGDLSRTCPLRMERPSGGIWERLSDRPEEAPLWQREAASACSVTSLIQELSLSDRKGHASAPPSKRQCRSLSFSDEMSSCRTSWRPLGSKVWTPVEKRRCYSGGSVPRCASGAATMQRSSSFSLPARANALPSSFDCAGFGSALGASELAPWGAGGRTAPQRSLSCSHEVPARPPSACGSPTSTPELPRRPPALPRSRSQPCVLGDKKVGVKRRCPEERPELRPSLDLAKMTQNRQTFNSLSCPGGATDDGTHLTPPRAAAHPAPASSDGAPGRTPACTPVPVPEPERPRARDGGGGAREELSGEEADYGDERGGKEAARAPWRRGGAAGGSVCPLGGEIDIEQIENN